MKLNIIDSFSINCFRVDIFLVLTKSLLYYYFTQGLNIAPNLINFNILVKLTINCMMDLNPDSL